MATSQVFSGARAVLKLSDKIVGYTLAMTGATAINYAPIDVCGCLAVVEHVPTGYTVEMTAQLSRLSLVTRLSPSAIQNPDWAITNDDISPQVMPAYGNDGTAILNSDTMTAIIYDRLTNGTLTKLYTIQGVKCSNKSWDVGARTAVAENCTFVATVCNEEGEGTSAIA